MVVGVAPARCFNRCPASLAQSHVGADCCDVPSSHYYVAWCMWQVRAANMLATGLGYKYLYDQVNCQGRRLRPTATVTCLSSTCCRTGLMGTREWTAAMTMMPVVAGGVAVC